MSTATLNHINGTAKPAAQETPLRGNYYAEGSYAQTDVKKGVTRNRSGARIITLSADFLLGLHKGITDECGPAAESVLKNCGIRWGTAFAKRFETELSTFHGRAVTEFPLAEFQACLVECFSHHGWGKLTIDPSFSDRGLIVVVVEAAIMAALLGRAVKPVDTLMAGTLAGFFRHFSGEDLDCIQTQCSACKAKDSRFVIGLTSRLAPAADMVAKGLSHGEVLIKLVDGRA
jgi:predicted hydrocarbon binding protein